MGQFFDEIPEFLISWIKKQQVFWVATAPLTADGHVNVSPKGLEGTFHVVNSRRVWYEDFSGSGVETISHIRENGRITILFNAFEGAPRIVRIFGHGTSFEFGTPEYNDLIPLETRQPGSRAVIMIDVHKVGSSCGYSVPVYEFKSHRTKLMQWADKMEGMTLDAEEQQKSPSGLRSYWVEWNKKSLDGLPGLLVAPDAPVTFRRSNLNVGYKKDDERTKDATAGLAGVVRRLGDVNLALGFAFGVLSAALVSRFYL